MQSARIDVAFSSEDVRTRAGLERWREVMGEAVLKLDLELVREAPFVSQVSASFLPDVAIARARKAGLRMIRGGALADASDSLSLHVATSGRWSVSQGGQRVDLGAGEAALVLNDEAASVECLVETTSTCIQFPRRALESRVRGVLDRALAPARGEAVDLLVDYLDLLEARPPRSPAVADAASAHVLDLVALVLAPARSGGLETDVTGVREAWRRRLERYVEVNASRHDLSLTAVASLHRLTPRYVQRLFAASGTTFSHHLLEARLGAARRHLLDPTDRRPISTIAYDVGFADISYFNRAFKRRYGERPGDVRAAARL